MMGFPKRLNLADPVGERVEAMVTELVAALEVRMREKLAEELADVDAKIERIAEAKAQAMLPAWVTRLPIMPRQSQIARRFADHMEPMRVEADGDPLDDDVVIRWFDRDSGREVPFPDYRLYQWTQGLVRDLASDPWAVLWNQTAIAVGRIATPAGMVEIRKFVARELLRRQQAETPAD